jgi:hypothetical protein
MRACDRLYTHAFNLQRHPRCPDWLRTWLRAKVSSFRHWPQCGVKKAPPDYRKFDWPFQISGGTWRDLERVGLIRLEDDYRSPHLCPVAIPSNWRFVPFGGERGRTLILGPRTSQHSGEVLAEMTHYPDAHNIQVAWIYLFTTREEHWSTSDAYLWATRGGKSSMSPPERFKRQQRRDRGEANSWHPGWTYGM